MSFNPENIAILAASGATIGSAFTILSSENYPNVRIFIFSRNSAANRIGYSSKYLIDEAAEVVPKEKPLDFSYYG